MTSFLAFSGSTRQNSFNQKVAALLASQIEAHGESAETISLGDYDMPLYNGDLETASGLPEATTALKAKLAGAGGLIIACPEYNGFMPPVLINAIDWCTRSPDASVDLNCFMNKPIFIAGASPGPGGGGRAANHLKTMLSGIGAYVSPFPLTVPAAFNAFDETGRFSDEGMNERAAMMMAGFVQFSQKFAT
ncbi:MAG: chromate reductase [bacterium]|jgi:chromate reductase